MPRDTKLTPELQTAICQYVAGGAPLPRACEAAGVSWNTAKEWSHREGEPWETFAEEVKRAKARWVVAQTMRLTKHAEKDWKAGAWLLERRDPEHFRPPPQRQQVTGKDDGPLQHVDLSHKTEAELLAIINAGPMGEPEQEGEGE